MKRFVSFLLISVLLASIFSGCGGDVQQGNTSKGGTKKETQTTPQGSSAVTDVINDFLTGLEENAQDSCMALLAPEIQSAITQGGKSMGDALRVDTHYSVLYSQRVLSARYFDFASVEFDFQEKEIKACRDGENKAEYCISYTVKLASESYNVPEEAECILAFTLVMADGQWRLQKMQEVSEKMNAQILVSGRVLREATGFNGGVAFVQYTEDEVSTEVAIDTDGNVLYTVREEMGNIWNLMYDNDIMVSGDVVYDKSGNPIASPEMTGYEKLLTDRSYNGYVLAWKVDQSHTGDVHYIGVLNNRGQWEHPLSNENPIVLACAEAKESPEEIYAYEAEEAIHEDVLKISIGFQDYYYDPVNNEISKGYVHYDTGGEGVSVGIYKFDKAGNSELVIPDMYGMHFEKDFFIGHTQIFDETQSEYVIGPTMVYDYEGNVLMDLSEYTVSVSSKTCSFNGYLLTEIDNGTGSEYLCLFDPNGELVFEPIRDDQYQEFYPLDANGFVLYSEDEMGKETYSYYDYSGNVITYDDVCYFAGFSDGLAYVKNSVDQGYYINYKGEIVFS